MKAICIHNIKLNIHCPFCWEMMKKLEEDPNGKRIIDLEKEGMK